MPILKRSKQLTALVRSSYAGAGALYAAERHHVRVALQTGQWLLARRRRYAGAIVSGDASMFGKSLVVLAGSLALLCLAACGKPGPQGAASAPPPAVTVPCDRACLEGLVEQFLEAVIAHDPQRVPFGKDLKYTENGQKLDLGDGMWRTLTARGTFRMFVTDVEAGQVAYLGSVKEDDIPAVIAVHLAVKNRRIIAAEVFLQNYDADRHGPRAADSLLYLAAAMVDLKDVNHACIALGEFADNFKPDAARRLKAPYDEIRSLVVCN